MTEFSLANMANTLTLHYELKTIYLLTEFNEKLSRNVHISNAQVWNQDKLEGSQL